MLICLIGGTGLFAYPAGSLAVVQPVDAGWIEPGMVIVFVDPNDGGRQIAHRVVKQLASDPPAFQTKGDANGTADPLPVAAASVRGKVAWAIPSLGGLVTGLRGAPAHPAGRPPDHDPRHHRGSRSTTASDHERGYSLNRRPLEVHPCSDD